MDKKLTYLGIIIISFLVGIQKQVTGQRNFEIDSLKAIINVETNPEITSDTYNELSIHYSDFNIDSAYFYANKALEKARISGYKPGQADAYYLLSFYNDRTKNQEKAISDMQNAIEIYTELGDSSNLSGCYNNLGVLYSYGTDQSKSLEYFIKAMNLGEASGETFALSEAYSNIGSYYEYLNEYVSALKYYTKALEVDLKSNKEFNIALSYITVGNINLKLQRFDNARDNLFKARKLISLVTDSYRKTELYINLASMFVETNQLDSAVFQLDKAKELNRKENYARLNADILTVEGDLFLKKKEYNSCLEHYDEAIKIYEQQNTFDVLYEIYVSKSKAYSELGKHDKAYQLLQDAQKLYDEFRPSKLAKILGDFEHAETLKEERTKLSLEQEVTKQKNEKEVILIRAKLRLAIFSIVFLVITIALIMYFYFLIRKQNTLLEENFKLIQDQKEQLINSYMELQDKENKLSSLIATKDKFFSIIAHDLKNPFNVLIGLSDVVVSDPEVRHSKDFDEIIEGIFKTAKSGYNLLDNLLEWSRSQTGDLEFKPVKFDINEIFTQNTALYFEAAKAKNIEIQNLVPPDVQVYADFNMVNFIVRNLLNNAIKFSFANSKIEFRLIRENDYLIFSVKDYGIGMNKDTKDKLFQIETTNPKPGTFNEKGSGLGLIICKEFIEKNKGEIWIESDEGKGSSFNFKLPVGKK